MDCRFPTFQEIVREPEFDGTGRIQPGEEFIRDSQIARTEIVRQLLCIACSQDWDDFGAMLLLEDPSNRELCGRTANLLRDRAQLTGNGQVALRKHLRKCCLV